MKDVGSVTPQLVVKEKLLEGFKKRGMLKEAPEPERVEKKSKRQEENKDEKGKKYKRLTAAFATTYNEANNSMTNENGCRKVIG